MRVSDRNQTAGPSRRYGDVHVSDHAQAIVGDSHYHVQIHNQQLEDDITLGMVDVNEIQTVSNLAWKLYKSCKSDPDTFSGIAQDLTSLRAVLEECEEIFPHIAKPLRRAQRLKSIISGCRDNLRQLETIASKYDNLAVRQKWTWQRMGAGSEELQEIRARIITHMSMLTTFMSTSQFYVEQRLEEMKREFSEGRMEESVKSALSMDSLADDDRSQWWIIRNELENHGIFPDMSEENKDFIYCWLERAIKTGAFEEQRPVQMSDEETDGESVLVVLTEITTTTNTFRISKSIVSETISYTKSFTESELPTPTSPVPIGWILSPKPGYVRRPIGDPKIRLTYTMSTTKPREDITRATIAALNHFGVISVFDGGRFAYRYAPFANAKAIQDERPVLLFDIDIEKSSSLGEYDIKFEKTGANLIPLDRIVRYFCEIL